MTGAVLLADLDRQGVRLIARGDRLRVEAPPGVVTPGLLDQIRDCKAELLRLLTAPVPAEGTASPVLLDPVTVRKVLGPSPAPDSLWEVEAEVTGALGQLRREAASGPLGIVPLLVRGCPLADWLSLDQIAQLIREGTPRHRGGAR